MKLAIRSRAPQERAVANTAAARSAGGPKGRRTRRLAWGSVLFLAPAAVVYAVFLVYPLLKSLVGSLFEWKGFRTVGFAGLENFERLFQGRNLELLTAASLHNVMWFFSILLVQNILGLLLAYILFLRGPRFSFFQAWFFFPAILSPVLVGALWKLLLAPGGPLEWLLRSTGLSQASVTVLGDSNWALWVLILVDIWNWIGLPILIFMAGLHAIDPEIFEAARLDGASASRSLWEVAVPLLIPSVSTLTILTFINSFSQFDLVYIMQGGQAGPNGATDTLVTLFYRLAFGATGSVGINDVGLALALGTLLFLFLVAVSLVTLRYFNRRSALTEG